MDPDDESTASQMSMPFYLCNPSTTRFVPTPAQPLTLTQQLGVFHGDLKIEIGDRKLPNKRKQETLNHFLGGRHDVNEMVQDVKLAQRALQSSTDNCSLRKTVENMTACYLSKRLEPLDFAQMKGFKLQEQPQGGMSIFPPEKEQAVLTTESSQESCPPLSPVKAIPIEVVSQCVSASTKPNLISSFSIASRRPGVAAIKGVRGSARRGSLGRGLSRGRTGMARTAVRTRARGRPRKKVGAEKRIVQVETTENGDILPHVDLNLTWTPPPTPPRRPKTPPRLPKTPPRRPKTPPRLPKTPPRLPKTPPRLPKTPPRLPKTPPRQPQTPPRRPQTPPRRPKTPPRQPLTPPPRPQTPPRRPQTPPRRPQTPPRQQPVLNDQHISISKLDGLKLTLKFNRPIPGISPLPRDRASDYGSTSAASSHSHVPVKLPIMSVNRSVIEEQPKELIVRIKLSKEHINCLKAKREEMNRKVLNSEEDDDPSLDLY